MTGCGVTVAAAGRLHLGFLDPSATLGRRFGSIGMMIDGLSTTVHLAFADLPRSGTAPQASHESERAGRIVAQLQQATGRLDPLHVHVSEALPAHAGLGSGTQLALALGRGFVALHGLRMTTVEIAGMLTRGRRSGIGIAGFDHGGFLVDGGHRDKVRGGTSVPPLLARFDFPPQWRVVLVLDPTRNGLHGADERSGLARLPILGPQQAAHLSHLVLLQILPALAEGDFEPFAEALSELQRVVGDYFAPVQGGVFTSPAVGRLMRWIAEHQVAAVGQSSWGPSAFAVLPSHEQAQRVLSSARAAGMIDEGLDVRIVSGRNQGAVVSSDKGTVRGIVD
jgi:beta-ribofuranosylaminobenzene 5'-phosphate synthase